MKKNVRKSPNLSATCKKPRIDISDILEDEIGGDKLVSPKRKRAPKPPKYEFKDENGELKTWTGQGRMPKALQNALDNGRALEEFLIK